MKGFKALGYFLERVVIGLRKDINLLQDFDDMLDVSGGLCHLGCLN